MKVVVVFLLGCVSGYATTINIYEGLPQNAGNFNPGPLNFSGDTLAGTFLASDINFGLPSFNWDPLGIGSNYGADITATIEVAADGMYTFNTSSDDGSLLFIDGQLVVNNNASQGFTERQGSIQLTAGQHNLEIQYFQGGGGNALTATLPSGVTYGPDPAINLPTLNIYQDPYMIPNPVPPTLLELGATLVGMISTENVNYGLPNSNWTPFGLTQQFSADMQGYFVIPADGPYTFSTGSDDGSYLFIDGQLVVNNGFYQGYTVRQGTVDLTAGNHLFELQYFQGGGGAALTLGVPAGVLLQPVPEPASWLPLCVLGGIATAAIFRRRRPPAAQPKVGQPFLAAAAF